MVKLEEYKKLTNCIACKKTFEKKSWNAKACSERCRFDYNNFKARSRKHLIYNRERLEFIIFTRDGYRCVFCGRTPSEDGVKLVLDHWKPVTLGGKTELSNLLTTCVRCNLVKNNHLLPDRIKPIVPRIDEAELIAMFGLKQDKMDKIKIM